MDFSCLVDLTYLTDWLVQFCFICCNVLLYSKLEVSLEWLQIIIRSIKILLYTVIISVRKYLNIFREGTLVLTGGAANPGADGGCRGGGGGARCPR
jgi:hypothetical protein